MLLWALRVQTCLETALLAQRRRCDDVAATHAQLLREFTAASHNAAAHDAEDVDKLRCRLGEVGRLLRQARLAEAELKQVRKTHVQAWLALGSADA